MWQRVHGAIVRVGVAITWSALYLEYLVGTILWMQSWMIYMYVYVYDAMEEKERAAYPGRTGQVESNPKKHTLCQRRLEHAVTKSKDIELSVCL